MRSGRCSDRHGLSRELLKREAATGATIEIRSIETIERSSGATRGIRRPLELIEQTLSRAGVEFIDENGGGPGVRLRKRLKSRG